jgi:hypothetical protein
LIGILAIQIFTEFVKQDDAAKFLKLNDDIYQRSVFEDEDNKGVLHQIFRQNEVNREIAKATLVRCALR